MIEVRYEGNVQGAVDMQFFDKLPGGRTVREERIDWAKVKNELMHHPGKWGLMVENISSSTPGQLRAGKNKHFRGQELEHFEFRVRRPAPKDDGSEYGVRYTDLYGRYTGPDVFGVGLSDDDDDVFEE